MKADSAVMLRCSGVTCERSPGGSEAKQPCSPSPVPQPTLEVPTVNDPEDEDHPIVHQHVVHHAVVTDPEPVERVRDPLDRLDRLAADPTRRGDLGRELLERSPDPGSLLRGKLLESADGSRREFDRERRQSSAPRLVVLPLA